MINKTPREIWWWKKVILMAIIVCLAVFLGALGGFLYSRTLVFGI